MGWSAKFLAAKLNETQKKQRSTNLTFFSSPVGLQPSAQNYLYRNKKKAMQKLSRVKAELAMLTKNPPPGIHCWQESTDLLKVEMTGPEGSPYEKGIFQLEVTISEKYPFTPPNVKFITPVYHPNVDPNGRICLSALKPKPSGAWNVSLNIPIVLSAIRVLLMEPNLADPLMTDIAKQYSENYKNYRDMAEAETKLHARAIEKKL